MLYTRIALTAMVASACVSIGWAAGSAARGAAKDARARHTGTVTGHLLTLNDFHGSIVSTRTTTVNGEKKPVGGAAVLTAMVRRFKAQNPNTLFVNAGDMVGGSPPLSALFQDEPAVEFLNRAGCDVGALGNHEFDEGVKELWRLWKGGPHPASRYHPQPFPGADFPVVCANILDERTGKPLLAPYVVKKVGGVRVGIIGAVTDELPDVTSEEAREGIEQIDPAGAINRWAAHLRRLGVRSIIVLIHEGGVQSEDGTLSGPILDVAQRLDKDVDIIVSAHSHQYHNAFVGKTLVIQARSHGEALGQVDFTIDRASTDIVRKRGRVVPAVHGAVTPAEDVAAMVANYEARSSARINRVVAQSAQEMKRPGRWGEYMLGNLIADAQREATGADIALMNPGGIRADLPAGPVTWGQAYSVQPFGNQLVTLKMTGAQVRAVLEQQWGPGAGGEPRWVPLLVSGITYTYDPEAPLGSRVVSISTDEGQPLDADRVYTVAANSFLAGGGDGFSAFQQATGHEPGPNDLDAFIAYLAAHPNVVPEMGRTKPIR